MGEAVASEHEICPLCELPMVACADFSDFACAQCGLAAPAETLTRLRGMHREIYRVAATAQRRADELASDLAETDKLICSVAAQLRMSADAHDLSELDRYADDLDGGVRARSTRESIT